MQQWTTAAKHFKRDAETPIGDVLLRRRAEHRSGQGTDSRASVPATPTVIVFLEISSGLGHLSKSFAKRNYQAIQ